MVDRVATPLAVLLCHFSDDLTVPYPRSRYEDIFTSVGAGKWSVPDYFSDMSHGKIDMSGNTVFDWLTLDHVTSDYAGSGANWPGRAELLGWAREAAEAANHDLTPYSSVVVVMNYARDLFGGPSGAACGDDGKNFDNSGMEMAGIGQEIGHIFGLNHSRIEPVLDANGDGAIDAGEDYTDPYDIMSAFTTWPTPNPYFTDRMVTTGRPVFRMGPGLNAANMDYVNWLDPDRVLTVNPVGSGQQQVELRPLHRRDLPGYLAVKFGDLYVEFRDGLGWDAGFNAGVQVRRLEDGISYLQSNWAGGQNSGPGDSYGTTEALSVKGAYVRIHVQSIDPITGVAQVLFAWQKPHFDIPVVIGGVPHREPWVVWGGVDLGDDLVIPELDVESPGFG